MNTGYMCKLSVIMEPADSMSAKLDSYYFLAAKENKIQVLLQSSEISQGR